MHGLFVARAFKLKIEKVSIGGMNMQITLEYFYFNCHENDEPIFTES
ncbi:hypothetical protein BC643_2186 [Mangrovibacterium diazotrophicum]|uniref:Uncharacterized protein n=1 Tax=Mangrovibacterium diazotrophicum TaxID=1261403 RepID=A0A419W8Q0_9BACT|nr:hypothetical protein BC643_2186 [Mangrovibacterium diazotrophicum]